MKFPGGTMYMCVDHQQFSWNLIQDSMMAMNKQQKGETISNHEIHLVKKCKITVC